MRDIWCVWEPAVWKKLAVKKQQNAYSHGKSLQDW